jgi:phage-related baseplate assembly protein
MRPILDEPNVFVQAAVPYAMRQELVAYAKQDGHTLSEEIRKSLRTYFQTRREAEPNLVSAA